MRNPFNPKLVSRIYLEDVDAFLFCTKNPWPILDYLPKIDKPVIFQITLTPYRKDVEVNVPNKSSIVEAIVRVSEIVGPERTFVRYDPIFLSDTYDIAYHKRAFEKLCSLIEGCVETIIVSFIDDYKNVRHNMNVLQVREFTEKDYEEIGKSFSASAKAHNLKVQTCFEERNLVEYGFARGECLSHEAAFKLTGKTYKNWTARKERKCNCVSMVDIGTYNTCEHFCKYCYANFDERRVRENRKLHDPASSLLIGELEEDDIIKRRYK